MHRNLGRKQPVMHMNWGNRWHHRIAVETLEVRSLRRPALTPLVRETRGQESPQAKKSKKTLTSRAR